MAGKTTVYLKAEQCIEVKKPDVTVGDLMAVECTDPIMLSKIKTIKVLKINAKEQRRYVMSILRVIELIHRQYQEVDIQNLGAPDMIIVYEKQQTPNKLFHLCKTAAVVLISFVGAAFSIMAFQNDVAMAKLFGQVYELLTGSPSDGFTILELTYSVGLTIGILIFFNHFGGRKFAVDPTPMEVEMRLYENDIQTTLIQNYSREQVEIDAGEPHPKGRGGSV
ncbi:MAG: stage V sporulation protein AA [Lachnospiraceae bacterium]|nr:stage V sporulation protein AA [Lachnospiraceae bacterium]